MRPPGCGLFQPRRHAGIKRGNLGVYRDVPVHPKFFRFIIHLYEFLLYILNPFFQRKTLHTADGSTFQLHIHLFPQFVIRIFGRGYRRGSGQP